MALEIAIIVIFTMLIGFGSLYLSFRRDAIAWSVIAAVIFIANIMFSASVDFGGGPMASSANYVLIGLNMLFAFIALIRSISMAFEVFKKR
jgi:hypothetical protein